MSTKWIVAVLSAVMWACGCTKTETIDASSGAPRQMNAAPDLVAQSRPPIPDVPMPVGFELDQGKSRNFAAAGQRYVDHLYKGGSDKYAVARFYKRQMPVSRWTLVTDMFAQGNITLDFEKQTERCRITVYDGSLLHPTKVKVQLWSFGKVTTPSGSVEGNQ
jgi:hypothetical protein